MDIEEAKKLARNKIEADALTRQVRDVIKTTKWQKQDMREGFKETFQPLIKSQDQIKKSIDEQQNKTLAQLQANQLALTQGLNQNRMAITQGLENLIYQPVEGQAEGQAEGQSEGQAEGQSEGQAGKKSEGQAEGQAGKKSEIATFNENDFDKYLMNTERIDILNKYGYKNLPSYFFYENINELEKVINDVNREKDLLNNELVNSAFIYTNREGYTLVKPINKRPHKKTLDIIEEYNTLSTYSKSLSDIYNYKRKIKSGSGMIYFNNPHQLLDRLELLGGSILAGNNGVIPEFSKIAHLLNQMKVITKKQLNNLIKTYITIR